MEKQTLLIIDDHPLIREGIKAILRQNPKFEVIGTAGTAKEGLYLTRKLHPNIVTVDLSLPDKSGIELTSEIVEHCPESKVVILSMHSKMDYIAESFQSGAVGYIIKEAASINLLHGIESVSNGETYIDSRVAVDVCKKLKGMQVKTVTTNGGGNSALTTREQQIMRLLAEGFSAKEVGSKLYISHKTVENHRSNIMKKLNLQSTIEMVRYAAKVGLIDVELWKA